MLLSFYVPFAFLLLSFCFPLPFLSISFSCCVPFALFPNRSLLLRVLMVTQKKGKERKRDRKRAWADSPETPLRDVAVVFGWAESPETPLRDVAVGFL